MIEKKIYKKGQAHINKIVVVILVVLVVASVLIFLFKVDILMYLRNLPGYSVPEDEEIDLTNLSEEEIENICPVRVGGLLGEKIFFCEDFTIACDKKIYSRLKWDKYNAKIKVDESWESDSTIGEITNGKVILKKEILGKTGELYEDVREDIKDLDPKFLENLNGSYYFSGDLICRGEVASNEK